MKKMPPPRYPGTEIEINALHLPPAMHTEWEEAADAQRRSQLPPQWPRFLTFIFGLRAHTLMPLNEVVCVHFSLISDIAIVF